MKKYLLMLFTGTLIAFSGCGFVTDSTPATMPPVPNLVFSEMPDRLPSTPPPVVITEVTHGTLTDLDNIAGGTGLIIESGYRIGLGVFTTLDASRSAEEERNGLAQVSSYYTVLTLDENNIIIAAAIDSTMTRVNFDLEGQIHSDLSAFPPTRMELGDAYGMRRASPIAREWNEQMNDFADWMVGRTPLEVLNMQLTEDHRPAEPDLIASVTIVVSDVLASVERAASNAK
ncbi:MAG: hypothetical protein FWE05_00500 [Defluviitaleaceae bacterium]|nr:hypothetical protein [Defluviitaleaceae bacterium]